MRTTWDPFVLGSTRISDSDFRLRLSVCVAKRMSEKLLSEFLQQDLKVLYFIKEITRKVRLINLLFSAIVSKHPWFDICVTIWIASFFLLCLGSFRHFVCVALNLLLVLSKMIPISLRTYLLCLTEVSRRILCARRPVEVDPKLKPLTDLNEDSYG